MRYLPEADFKAITQRVVPIESSTPPKVGDEFFASRAEFALETHLEEFMEQELEVTSILAPAFSGTQPRRKTEGNFLPASGALLPL